MDNLDLSKPLARLESGELEEQIRALDEATAILKEFGKRLVDRYVRCDDRYLIAERLIRFGPFVIEPLKEVLSQAEDIELRTLSATVLLYLGDRAGVPMLIEIISSDETFSALCLAASLLAKAQIFEVGDSIIKRLRSLTLTNRPHIREIQCLLVALEKLGRTLPSDLVERFQGSDVPWEVQIYLKKPSQ
jgi:hypothetical protein